MSKRKKPPPLPPVVRAIRAIHPDSPTAVARTLGHGVIRQHVEHWLKVGRVPVERAALLSKHSGVPVWELLPEDWFAAFPMLVGAPGAPAVPEPEEEAAAG